MTISSELWKPTCQSGVIQGEHFRAHTTKNERWVGIEDGCPVFLLLSTASSVQYESAKLFPRTPIAPHEPMTAAQLYHWFHQIVNASGITRSAHVTIPRDISMTTSNPLYVHSVACPPLPGVQ